MATRRTSKSSSFGFFTKLASALTTVVGVLPRIGARIFGALDAVVTAVKGGITAILTALTQVLKLGTTALDDIANKLDAAFNK